MDLSVCDVSALDYLDANDVQKLAALNVVES